MTSIINSEKIAINKLKREFQLEKRDFEIDQKGHVVKIDLSWNQINKIEGLEEFSQLQKLDLTGNQITKIDDLKVLPNLQIINFSRNQIHKINGLEEFSQLEELNFSGNKIHKIEVLEKNSEIRVLSLDRNKIKKMEGFKNLSQLLKLDLSVNLIKKIEGLDNNSKLNILNLSHNQINNIEGLEKLSQLTSLDISYNNIRKIDGLYNSSKLSELNLGFNKIEKIAGLERLSHLKILDLCKNQISKIAGLEKLSQLESLILQFNPIKHQEFYLCKDAQAAVRYCQRNRKSKESTKLKKLIRVNKKRIHSLILNEKLKRCPLHEELYSDCQKYDSIKQEIKSTGINGFFMYQFPKDPKRLENIEEKQENENYIKELNLVKKLIDRINEDPIIRIWFPNEVTDLDIKTCSFCRIARSYDFGIALLYPWNPNVYLETGMFLSLGKKVILLNNEAKSPKAPFDLSAFFYIPYKNLEELEQNWNKKLIQIIKRIRDFYLKTPKFYKKYFF